MPILPHRRPGPDEDFTSWAARSDDLSTFEHRQAIGWIGLFLPILLIGLAWGRPIPETRPWRLLYSLSAYYYTASVPVFVGLLFALAVFFFTYAGYRNEHHYADRLTAVTAAVAALGLTFFPTGPPPGMEPPEWWTPASGRVHNFFAVVLFSALATFSLWLFRLRAPGEAPSAGKRRRNRVYLVCGILMAGSMVGAAITVWLHRPMIVPESVAVEAFAVSWLVKGRAHYMLVRRLVGRQQR